MEKRAWAGTTFGNPWMHRQLIAFLRHVDVRFLYAVTALFVVPVCLVVNASGGIMYRLYRRRMGYSRLHALWSTYANHCRFAQAVIDKFAMFAGQHFAVTVQGREHFDRLERQSEAFMMLSSHIGNYELAGFTLHTRHKRMNALVFGGEKATVMAHRDKLLAQGHIRMIPVGDDMSHLFAINSALSDGEIVSMPADRVVGSPRTLDLKFLGRQAAFPLGPFQTATMRGLDVLVVSVMKTSVKGYTIYVTPLAYDHTALRKEQTRQLAESFVAELERRVRQYPTQWYNYFEFWK